MLHEIKEAQRSTHCPIPKAPLLKLVKGLLTQYNTNDVQYRLSKEALGAISDDATMFLVDLFTDSCHNATFAKRVTIQDKDLHLAVRYYKKQTNAPDYTRAAEMSTKEVEAYARGIADQKKPAPKATRRKAGKPKPSSRKEKRDDTNDEDANDREESKEEKKKPLAMKRKRAAPKKKQSAKAVGKEARVKRARLVAPMEQADTGAPLAPFQFDDVPVIEMLPATPPPPPTSPEGSAALPETPLIMRNAREMLLRA